MPDDNGKAGHRRRLRDRFFDDTEALPDYELLELLLCIAQPRSDMKPAAKRLLDAFGDLGSVLSQDRAALTAVAGVGDAGAAALLAVREAACRLLRQQLRTHNMGQRPATNQQRSCA